MNSLHKTIKTTVTQKFLFLLLPLTLAVITSSLALAADDTAQVSSRNSDNFVTVGDPGNWADSQGLGAVATPYQIGKYEVTALQYATFLNAVATKEDPHGLYHCEMGNDQKVASITRNTNADGTFIYDVISTKENLPITYVSLNDAERYCNWLENGSPTNDQDDELLQQSTESGAYNFSTDANGNEIVEASTNALVHIPSQDEWVKAAYYNGHGTNAGYALYPTKNNTAPILFHNGKGATLLSNEVNYGNESSISLPVITPVNKFINTSSSYQACDMGGNVAEWTTTPLATHSSLIIAKGGSWKSAYSWWGSNDLMRTAPPKGYDPSVGTNFIGFRIAIAIPTSSVLAAGKTPSNHIKIINTDKNGSLIELTSEEKDAILGLFLFWGALTGTTTIMIGSEIIMDYFFLGMDAEAICETFPTSRRIMIPIHIFCGGTVTDYLLNQINTYIRPLLMKE